MFSKRNPMKYFSGNAFARLPLYKLVAGGSAVVLHPGTDAGADARTHPGTDGHRGGNPHPDPGTDGYAGTG